MGGKNMPKLVESPIDLMGRDCECGSDEFYEVGCTSHGETIYECTNCGKIAYGCD